MRTYIIFSLFILCACSKYEEPISKLSVNHTQSDIIRIANEGIKLLEGSHHCRTTNIRSIQPNEIFCKLRHGLTRSNNNTDTLYYVVNYAENNGYAIISANRQLPENQRLFAAIEHGHYNPNVPSTNEGFNLFITTLESIDSIWMGGELIPNDSIDHGFGRFMTEYIYSDWVSKGPHLTVQWGQGVTPSYNINFPYNKYCYEQDYPYSLCRAGCSATAIAQIMSYYQHPQTYRVTFNGSNTQKTLDWGLLCNCTGGYSYYWPTMQAEDIALLFREIGKNCGMEYRAGQGLTDITKSRSAFSTMGYNRPTIINEYNYSLIKTELDSDRLIWMEGFKPDSNIGHAWVVDGYKWRTCTIRTYMLYEDRYKEYIDNVTSAHEYIHINWGYDGQNNGYFQSGVFNLMNAYEYDEAEGNYNIGDYANGIKMLTNIKPN